jgi:hypothetical protein
MGEKQQKMFHADFIFIFSQFCQFMKQRYFELINFIPTDVDYKSLRGRN